MEDCSLSKVRRKLAKNKNINIQIVLVVGKKKDFIFQYVCENKSYDLLDDIVTPPEFENLEQEGLSELVKKYYEEIELNK